MIEVTPLALEQIRIRTQLPENEGKDARIFLDSKRCDGFGVDCTFDQPTGGDNFICVEDVVILVHANTALVVAGGTLDYDPATAAFDFKLVNPEGYKGKFFKSDKWNKRETARKIELIAPLMSDTPTIV